MKKLCVLAAVLACTAFMVFTGCSGGGGGDDDSFDDPPDPGTLTLTLTETDGSLSIAGDTPVVLYQTGGVAQAILTIAAGYTSYQWEVDKIIKGTANSITLDAGDYTPGGHSLSVIVYKGTVPYSADISFTVNES
jgi:hypothetical protein